MKELRILAQQKFGTDYLVNLKSDNKIALTINQLHDEVLVFQCDTEEEMKQFINK